MTEYMHMERAGGLWAAVPAPSVCRCISGHLIGLERHLYTNICVIREHCAGETRRLCTCGDWAECKGVRVAECRRKSFFEKKDTLLKYHRAQAPLCHLPPPRLSFWKLLLYKVVRLFPEASPSLLLLPPILPLPSLQVVPAGTGSLSSTIIINSGLCWALQGEMMQLLSHTTSEAPGSSRGK